MELKTDSDVRDFLNKNRLRLYPVISWGEFYYAQLGPIELKTGVQRIPVINVTNQPDLLWFHRDSSQTVTLLNQREIFSSGISLSIAVGYGEETFAKVAQKNGQAIQLPIEDLPFTIQPPTDDERNEAIQQQHDEKETH